MSYTLVKGRFLITASDSDETPEIPLQGSVSFTPTAQIILDNEEIYADSTIVAPLDKEGYISYKKKRGVSLLTPDPGQTNPESFTYKVDFNLHYGREKYTYRTFYLDLSSSSSEVNLADHIPVKESGVPFPGYVTQGRGIVSITRNGDGETATILFTDGASSELSLPRGLDAKTPNFSIGEVVESTSPSADLQVSPSGDYILNLSLPKGADGVAPENPTFRVASVTSEPYGSLPSVRVEGEYPNLQLHFSIPSGADGSPGVTKEDLEGSFALISDVDKKLKQISVDTSPFKAGSRYYSPVTYYWPDYYKKELSQWSKVLKFGDSLGIVILNRNSGDWASYDKDFHTQGQLAKGAGAKRSIFYVKTQYGAAGNPEEWGVGVPNADKYTKEYIIQELDYCRTHYPDIFDGVFLDEFINGWGHQEERVSWYKDLVDTIRARYGSQFLIVGNCGSNCSEAVLSLDVDVFMSYESTADKYIHEDTSAPIHPAHMAKHPGTRFWHVVHDVTKENYLQVFEKAESLGIGHLYITDGKLVMGEGGQWEPDVNPYAVAPSQWIEDVFTPWVKGVLDTRILAENLNERVANLEVAGVGKTPTLSIGEVVTVGPDADASASIVGSPENPVLNLSLPKGEPGEDAVPPKLSIGSVATADAGTQAQASITGTYPDYTLNLSIPKGEPGGQGKDETVVISNPANMFMSGEGQPEGRVVASVGTTYVDTLATAGAVRWVKTSGTGNIGWKVEYGDTGWRNISSLVPAEFKGYLFWVRRVTNETHLYVNVSQQTGTLQNFQFPAGFKLPSFDLQRNLYRGGVHGTVVGSFRLYQGAFYYTGGTSQAINGSSYEVYASEDAWPSTLPGTPA